jgi:TonB family protein
MAHVLEIEPYLEPPASWGPLVAMLVCSAVLHSLLIYFAPSLGQAKLPLVVYTEVELLRMPEAPPMVRKSPPTAPPSERAAPKKVWQAVEAEAAARLERRAVEALRRARTESLGATLDYPGLALALPETPSGAPSEGSRPAEELLVQESIARAGRAVVMPGIPEGKELLAEPGIAGERKPFSVASETARKLAKRLMEAELAREPVPTPAPVTEGIKGPAALRQVLYRPPSPSVKVERDTTMLLKFWVRSDGTVGQVVPERKGDPRLEAVAVRFLKGWRFNPLAEEGEEQWGTISIAFRRP